MVQNSEKQSVSRMQIAELAPGELFCFGKLRTMRHITHQSNDVYGKIRFAHKIKRCY